MRYMSYSQEKYAEICAQASCWKISKYHDEGSDSRGSKRELLEKFDIPRYMILAENDCFAGVIAYSDFTRFIDLKRFCKKGCAALTKDWQGTPIELTCCGKSYHEFDYGESMFGDHIWDLKCYYLEKKES